MDHLLLNIIRIGIVFTLGEYMNRSRGRVVVVVVGGLKLQRYHRTQLSAVCCLHWLASDEIDIISGLIHVVFQKQGL